MSDIDREILDVSERTLQMVIKNLMKHVLTPN